MARLPSRPAASGAVAGTATTPISPVDASIHALQTLANGDSDTGACSLTAPWLVP